MVWDEIRTQAVDFSLSQSEAFPPLSPEHSDVAREHDIILPIKGKCVCMFKALHSDIWLLALGLCLGDPVLCSWQESRAFPQGYSCHFNGKNAFMPYYLLSLFRPHSPCAATTSRLRRLVSFWINARPASSQEASNVQWFCWVPPQTSGSQHFLASLGGRPRFKFNTNKIEDITFRIAFRLEILLCPH